MRRIGMLLVGGAMTALAVGALPSLLAAQDPTPIVKERQETMKQLGGHMKAINEFVEKSTGSAEDVASRAAAIREIAGKIPTLFPQGTSLNDGVGKTAAKPEIWSDWAGFQAAATKMGEEAGKLAEVAAAGDAAAIGAQFGSLGKNGCGGCHQIFRQKQD